MIKCTLAKDGLQQACRYKKEGGGNRRAVFAGECIFA
jgi:hypothetical protein